MSEHEREQLLRLLKAAYVYTAADSPRRRFAELVGFLGDPDTLFREYADDDDDARDWLAEAGRVLRAAGVGK